jgi:hypothetical protein
MSMTKPFHKPMKGKLTLEQKISLWCECFKVKPCKIHIERMEGLEGLVPWCVVHMRYDCFCSGQSINHFCPTNLQRDMHKLQVHLMTLLKHYETAISCL